MRKREQRKPFLFAVNRLLLTSQENRRNTYKRSTAAYERNTFRLFWRFLPVCAFRYRSYAAMWTHFHCFLLRYNACGAGLFVASVVYASGERAQFMDRFLHPANILCCTGSVLTQEVVHAFPVASYARFARIEHNYFIWKTDTTSNIVHFAETVTILEKKVTFKWTFKVQGLRTASFFLLWHSKWFRPKSALKTMLTGMFELPWK